MRQVGISYTVRNIITLKHATKSKELVKHIEMLLTAKAKSKTINGVLCLTQKTLKVQTPAETFKPNDAINWLLDITTVLVFAGQEIKACSYFIISTANQSAFLELLKPI